MPKRSTLALIGMLCLLVVLGVLVFWAGGCAKSKSVDQFEPTPPKPFPAGAPEAHADDLAGQHVVNGEIVK